MSRLSSTSLKNLGKPRSKTLGKQTRAHVIRRSRRTGLRLEQPDNQVYKINDSPFNRSIGHSHGATIFPGQVPLDNPAPPLL